jgi:hypothetical protein
MVLDTKKGLLKADKEKGQYVNSEKENRKRNRKKELLFFDIAHARAQKALRSNAKIKAAIQFFFFTLFFYLIKLGQQLGPVLALSRLEHTRSRIAPSLTSEQRSRLGSRCTPDALYAQARGRSGRSGLGVACVARPQTSSVLGRRGGQVLFFLIAIGSGIARSRTFREEQRAQPPSYGRSRRSKTNQTTMKSVMKIQKRTRILDAYKCDEKIREKTISD